MSRVLELQVRGSHPVELDLPDVRVTLGSGSGSDLRVPESSGLVDRHLWLTPGDDGVAVAVADHAPAALIFRGQELRAALVPWGDEAYIANARLGFASRNGGPRRSSALLLLMPVSLLLLGVASFATGEPEIAPTKEVEAPELVGSPARCRENQASRALRAAREAERAALAKMQRSAFVTHEGLDAMDLLEEARQCFRVASHEAESQRVAAALQTWTEHLNDDYSAARLRLRLGLTEERSEDALAAIRELEALLASRPPSPYTEWLTELRRRLERKKGGS